MHQDSKSSRQLSISSVGTKHRLTLLLSLSEKWLGSNGTSNYSEGCHAKGLSSLDIWILFRSLAGCDQRSWLEAGDAWESRHEVLLCFLFCLPFDERARKQNYDQGGSPPLSQDLIHPKAFNPSRRVFLKAIQIGA